MKRKLLLTLIIIPLWNICSWSQKLNAQQQEQVIQKIVLATASIKTMQCDFKQTKKMKMMKNQMKSSGTMYYKSPNKLRWQYNTPYSYIFVMNGSKVSVKSANGIQHIDAQHNKIFKQISNIILGCVTGGNLKNSGDFSIEIWKENGSYSAKLVPKKKEYKSLYNYINIKFNSSLSMIENVEMSEKSGDTTFVNLFNVKVNHSVGENFFTVN